MLKIKLFWYTLMGGSLGLYALIIASFFMFPDSAGMVAIILCGVIALHTGEIPVAKKIAAVRNVSFLRAIIKTILFGFTWWVPLRKGILTR